MYSTDKDMEFTSEENGNRSFTESCVCRLDLWFPDLSIHWNHLGGFKPLRGLSLIPGDCSLIGLQDGLVRLWDPQVMLMCRRFRNHWVRGQVLSTHTTHSETLPISSLPCCYVLCMLQMWEPQEGFLMASWAHLCCTKPMFSSLDILLGGREGERCWPSVFLVPWS